jgi:hypothetical protein
MTAPPFDAVLRIGKVPPVPKVNSIELSARRSLIVPSGISQQRPNKASKKSKTNF